MEEKKFDLNSIIGFSELLLEDITHEKYRDYLKIILNIITKIIKH